MTSFRCWYPTLFEKVQDVGDQKAKHRHQHLKVVANTFRHQHQCGLVGFFETKTGFYCYVKDQSAKHSNCLIDGKGRTRKDGGPKYQAELKSKLYSFFKSYNDELFEWIGEDFGWNTNI